MASANYEIVISDLANKANAISIADCDLNELIKQGSGIYIARSQLKNAPTNLANFHYYVIQMCYSKVDYASQIAVPVHSEGIVWIRRCVAMNWSSWEKLHTGLFAS